MVGTKSGQCFLAKLITHSNLKWDCYVIRRNIKMNCDKKKNISRNNRGTRARMVEENSHSELDCSGIRINIFVSCPQLI